MRRKSHEHLMKFMAFVYSLRTPAFAGVLKLLFFIYYEFLLLITMH